MAMSDSDDSDDSGAGAEVVKEGGEGSANVSPVKGKGGEKDDGGDGLDMVSSGSDSE